MMRSRLESPPYAPTPKQRAIFERALRGLGRDVQVILHRVGLVQNTRVGFDAWFAGPDARPASAHAAAQEGLHLRDLSRLASRDRARFIPLEGPPGAYDAWFFDEQRLMGRVRLRAPGELTQPKLRAAGKALDQAWRSLSAQRPSTGAHGTIVMDPHGRILGRDTDATASLTAQPELQSMLSLLANEARVPAVLLRGESQMIARPLEGLAASWLVELSPTRSVRLSVDAALTPTQRTIAEYAVVGATVEEIAVTLSSGKETVRSHLREIYRRLEVANRVELVRALSVA